MHDQSNPMEGTRGAIVAMTKIGSHPWNVFLRNLIRFIFRRMNSELDTGNHEALSRTVRLLN